jgi:predicted Holliday junction resolvase-like endonuclease
MTVLLIALIILLILIAAYLYFKKRELEEEMESLLFEKRSQSVRYGKLTEQFVPFIKDFPFNPEQFRFIGNPVDGVVFGEEGITFCEFKAAGAKLNERQRKLKELVKGGKVRWFEFSLR